MSTLTLAAARARVVCPAETLLAAFEALAGFGKQRGARGCIAADEGEAGSRMCCQDRQAGRQAAGSKDRRAAAHGASPQTVDTASGSRLHTPRPSAQRGSCKRWAGGHRREARQGTGRRRPRHPGRRPWEARRDAHALSVVCAVAVFGAVGVAGALRLLRRCAGSKEEEEEGGQQARPAGPPHPSAVDVRGPGWAGSPGQCRPKPADEAGGIRRWRE